MRYTDPYSLAHFSKRTELSVEVCISALTPNSRFFLGGPLRGVDRLLLRIVCMIQDRSHSPKNPSPSGCMTSFSISDKVIACMDMRVVRSTSGREHSQLNMIPHRMLVPCSSVATIIHNHDVVNSLSQGLWTKSFKKKGQPNLKFLDPRSGRITVKFRKLRQSIA
jgi:hypothetical protein